MKYVFSALVETAEILKRYPHLFFVYLGFHFVDHITALPQIPGIIKLGLWFVVLGWLGSRYVYLEKAYHHKRFDYKNLHLSIWSWANRLLPLVLALFLFVGIPILILIYMYSNWLLMQYGAQVGIGSLEALINSAALVTDGAFWMEYISRYPFMRFVYQFYQLSVIIGILLAKVMLILMVLEKFRLREALVRSFFYLNEQLPLLGVFIVMQIFINIILSSTLLLFSPIAFSLIDKAIFMTLFSFFAFFKDAFVLSYYIKSDKRNFVVRNLMHWWHSKGSWSR